MWLVAGGGSGDCGEEGHADAVSAILRFADGSVGTIVYSSLGDPSLPKEYLKAFASGRGGHARRLRRVDDPFRREDEDGEIGAGQGSGEPSRRIPRRGEGARRPAPIPLEEIDAVSRATIAIEEALRGGGGRPL